MKMKEKGMWMNVLLLINKKKSKCKKIKWKIIKNVRSVCDVIFFTQSYRWL